MHNLRKGWILKISFPSFPPSQIESKCIIFLKINFTLNLTSFNKNYKPVKQLKPKFKTDLEFL